MSKVERREDVERYNEIFKALYDVRSNLSTEHSFDVVAIYMQGSQNYGLDVYTDTYKSDIDMKAFIIPSLDDLYYNRMVSTKYKTPYGEVEVKDIRLFIELIKKANLTYLELLCTEFKLVEQGLDYALRGMADVVVRDRRVPFLNALRGTAKQKYDGVFKYTEGTKHIYDKFGYQPKELHHLLRLLTLATYVVARGQKLSESYRPEPNMRAFLKKVKTGEEFGNNVELVAVEAKEAIDKIDAIINPILEDKTLTVDDSSINELNRRVLEIFKHFIGMNY